MPEDFIAKLFGPPDIEVVRHGPFTCQPIETFVREDGKPMLKAYGRCCHCQKIVLTGEFVWFQTLMHGRETGREVAHYECDLQVIADEEGR
jgi:hypothetical protein